MTWLLADFAYQPDRVVDAIGDLCDQMGTNPTGASATQSGSDEAARFTGPSMILNQTPDDIKD